MTDTQILEGGCACGQLRFMARGAPKRVGLCHCLTCRKVSGSAFNAFAVFPADAVTVTGAFATWAASPHGERAFCPSCGSQVFAREGGEMEMKLGAFDAPNVFTPSYEAWVPRREAWLKTTSLTVFERNREDPSSSPK
ncbi:MAG: GFA family protein [Pseudomonadota bacterium]|nr:GFA family protein [Pseudomonadota bacterium]